MLPLHSSCGLSHTDGTIYVGYVDGLYAVNPDGTLRWSFGTGDQVRSSPTVASDGTIYFGSDDEYLYAVNPDGSQKWRYQTGGSVYSSPAIGADGTVYAADNWDDLLYAIAPNGTLKWTFGTGRAIESSPAIGPDGTIYIGSEDNYLYAVNPDGSQKWKYNTGGDVHSSPTVDADRGAIYVGSNSDKVFAIDTSGTLMWETSLGHDVGYSSPALSDPNDVLYIGDVSGKFFVIDIDSGEIICSNDHSWRITSPAIDDPANNGGNWCVWYNEFCTAIYKVCSPPLGVEEGCSSAKNRLHLDVCPNPCVTSARISFVLPSRAQVSIEIYDIAGSLVRTLVTGTRSAGEHTLEWDAENLARGIYFCKLTTETGTLIRKQILIK
jgi:outer membrane protein assembly factor BamB